jgi:hypothetical protein
MLDLFASSCCGFIVKLVKNAFGTLQDKLFTEMLFNLFNALKAYDGGYKI